ncbi:MAG TPA: hypothetical protein VGM83_04735 [Devosiaceae bacterium]|jgi:hypothetical protein
MSARIAPLPDGMGISSITDKQSRRSAATPGRRSSKTSPTAPSPDLPAAPDPASIVLPSEDETLPAGTLFAAAVLSAQLPAYPASLDQIQLRQNRDWTPPESTLRLTDKTI